MDDTPHEPLIVWQFLRRHFVRIVIGAVLAGAAYGVVSVYATHQREQRIGKEIESHGGTVEIRYAGPDCIPLSVRSRLRCFDRIRMVRRLDQTVPSDLLSELGSLTNLVHLDLSNTNFTDARLEHLRGLTSLEWLYLSNTQVTDSGLVYLTGLSRLKTLYLAKTKVTDAGLEHLKGLSRLETLGLLDTQVTDAGLEHLKGLTCLRVLWLHNTQVTSQGRARLRSAVPGCNIGP